MGEDGGSALAWGDCGLGWGYFAVGVDEELVEKNACSVLPFLSHLLPCYTSFF